MHNFIKNIILVLSLISLCSCSAGCRLEYIDKSYQTDTVDVNLQIPQLKGLSDKDFQDAVNLELADTCGEFLNKFKESAKNLSYPSVFTSETRTHETSGIFSIVTQIDYYTQKPHNNSFRITKNIDTKKSEHVTLADLFRDDSYIDFINQTLVKIVSDNPDSYSDLWSRPCLSENQEFYISDNNLILYYPPYELSYYSRGFVEFLIPLTDLNGYLKEEYQTLTK